MFEIIEGIQPEDRRDRESNGEIAADRDSGEADFPVFRVVEGKLSDRYNHLLDYAFDSCTATNTRLMGVVAMRLDWHSVFGRKYHLCQLIHLDFSEYGIDDYMEYFSDPALRGYSDIFSKPELDMQWMRISGSLGGEEVSLSLDEAMLLIDRALLINQKYRGQHPEEIREFREAILPRIELMRTQVSGSPDLEETLLKVCPKKLSANETINYFLMRLFDHDFDAACLLTSLSREELEELPAARHGLMTLTRNEISRDSGPSLFHRSSGETVHCLSLAEMEQYPGYRYLRTALVVSPHPDRKWYCVTECGCEFDMNISQAEAALQLREPE
ncbi:MAG: hypothetical protein IJH77_05505, partial [Mogibacterium sp.]|nr:hypothetical protein [Mogibacterium sp.]